METKDKLCLSVAEVSKLLNLSRNATYQACMTGEIPAIRIGRRVLVPTIRLEAMLAGKSEAKETCDG
jgi:excisionase family DNA binding protein